MKFLQRVLPIVLIATALPVALPSTPAAALSGEKELGVMQEWPFDISADGSVALLSIGAGDTKLINTRTGATRILPDGLARGRLTPNGKSIVHAAFSDLVPADTNGLTDYYRHDIATGSETLLSGGMNREGWELEDVQSISADGSVLGFQAGDGNLALIRVAIWDSNTKTLTFPDAVLDGSVGRRQSNKISVSADGRTVAWHTFEVAGGLADIGIWHRSTGRIALLKDADPVVPIGAREISLSADGTHVAFVSSLNTVIPGLSGNDLRVFVHNIVAGTTKLVGGLFTQRFSQPIWISTTGRYVSYLRETASISSGEPQTIGQPFVFDTTTGVVHDIGQPNPPAKPNGFTTEAVMSADASTVVFSTYATNFTSPITRPTEELHRLFRATVIPPVTLPARLLDTRSNAKTVDALFAGRGALKPGVTLQLQVAGRAGIGVNAKGVWLNVTVTGASGAGELIVYPCRSAVPPITSLSFEPVVARANLLSAAIDSTGKVCLRSTVAAHVVADVASVLPATSKFTRLPQARILDTRPTGNTVDGQFRRGGALSAGSVLTLTVAGRGGVLPTAKAVSLTVTAAGAAGGYLTVWPCGARPNASTLNFAAGVQQSATTIAQLSAAGKVCVFASAAVHLRADLTGSWPAPPDLTTVVPGRLLDTRSNGVTVDGRFRRGGIRAAGSTLELQIGGRHGLPTGRFTALLNVAATATAANGYITLYPCGARRPLAASLNPLAGRNVNNLVAVTVPASGKVCIYTSSATHVVADITGRIG